jgi:hypothetical protein
LRDLADESQMGCWSCELRPMPFKEKVLVRSPAFTIELHGRDAGAFTSEVEAKAVNMIRKYPIKIEVAKA